MRLICFKNKRALKVLIPALIHLIIAMVFWTFQIRPLSLIQFPILFALILGVINWKYIRGIKPLTFTVWIGSSASVLLFSMGIGNKINSLIQKSENILSLQSLLKESINNFGFYSFYLISPMLALILSAYIFKLWNSYKYILLSWMISSVVLLLISNIELNKSLANTLDSYPISILLWQLVMCVLIQLLILKSHNSEELHSTPHT